MVFVEDWRGLHVDLHPTHIAFAGRRIALERCNAPKAAVAEEDGQAVRKGQLAGWGGV